MGTTSAAWARPRTETPLVVKTTDASGATALTGWRRGLVGEALLAQREQGLGR